MSIDINYSIIEDFMERKGNALELIINQFENSPPGTIFSWSKVRAAKIKRIWLDFGKAKVLRDEKGMALIKDQILNNIALLRATTELLGHTNLGCEDVLEGMGKEYLIEKQEKLFDFLTDERGMFLCSDYGLPKLEKLYGDLYKAESAEDQLYAADKILNVIHTRSDLASFFIEGGSKTLSEIASQGGYYEEA